MRCVNWSTVWESDPPKLIIVVPMSLTYLLPGQYAIRLVSQPGTFGGPSPKSADQTNLAFVTRCCWKIFQMCRHASTYSCGSRLQGYQVPFISCPNRMYTWISGNPLTASAHWVM